MNSCSSCTLDVGHQGWNILLWAGWNCARAACGQMSVTAMKSNCTRGLKADSERNAQRNEVGKTSTFNHLTLQKSHGNCMKTMGVWEKGVPASDTNTWKCLCNKRNKIICGKRPALTLNEQCTCTKGANGSWATVPKETVLWDPSLIVDAADHKCARRPKKPKQRATHCFSLKCYARSPFSFRGPHFSQRCAQCGLTQTITVALAHMHQPIVHDEAPCHYSLWKTPRGVSV